MNTMTRIGLIAAAIAARWHRQVAAPGAPRAPATATARRSGCRPIRHRRPFQQQPLRVDSFHVERVAGRATWAPR